MTDDRQFEEKSELYFLGKMTSSEVSQFEEECLKNPNRLQALVATESYVRAIQHAAMTEAESVSKAMSRHGNGFVLRFAFATAAAILLFLSGWAVAVQPWQGAIDEDLLAISEASRRPASTRHLGGPYPSGEVAPVYTLNATRGRETVGTEQSLPREAQEILIRINVAPYIGHSPLEVLIVDASGDTRFRVGELLTRDDGTAVIVLPAGETRGHLLFLRLISGTTVLVEYLLDLRGAELSPR